MRTNESILEATGKGDFLIEDTEAITLMKEAQVEALKELVKRKNIHHPFSNDYKSIDMLALEMIKEIENGSNSG